MLTRRGVLASSRVQVEPEAVEPEVVEPEVIEPTAPRRPTRSTRRERIPTCPRPPPNSINDTTIDLTDDSVDQQTVQDNVFLVPSTPDIQMGNLALTIPRMQTRESENPGLNQEEGLVIVDDTLEEEDEERAGDISERVIEVDTEEEVNVEQEEEVVRLGNTRDIRDVTIIDLTNSPAPPRIRSRENSSGSQSNTATHQDYGTCPICLELIWELKKDGLISTVCGHVFCSPCFYSSLYRTDVHRPTCPVCRGSLSRRNAYHPVYL
ncbi:E3 ubiquitin-protein ligase RNF4 [Eurytemora carolleeae]|uniref:E3 ubiquitin-protein ligase RNF4 n=1 Tax=Eurytemora carolleeae TaxID=1294199 RepID=UPI000C78E696|nr:E3 ubiquitin-protein ligase RNF4 [Eurytemora carolleeae]|eukprot:XP_023341691.1 E3 ubiquitin-protein ligase RNF4-like [Eurytemora affinis]